MYTTVQTGPMRAVIPSKNQCVGTAWPVAPRLGQLGKRFDIRRELGAGGMGIVYEAFDRERGHDVALKTLTDPSPEHLLRLKREFRYLAGLEHPNLVSLYELFADEDVCFYTMEIVRGVDFSRFVERHPDQLRPAALQAARAVRALHAADVIHRDIKPSNLLVTDDGRVVLLDFGVAADVRPHDRESGFGDVVGTIEFMAPEQGAGERAHGPADWYAFGALLYHALTGRPPFTGPPMKVLLDKVQQDAPPPSSIAPDVPPDLDALCTALLSREPHRRPAADEVLSRLGAGDTQTRGSTHTSIIAVPFTGRAAELTELERGLAALEHGTESALILLEGESGVGKTTLVNQLVVRARGRFMDLVAVRGRCYEHETIAYKALDSLVDDLSAYWRRLPDDEARAIVPPAASLLPRLFPVLGRVPAVAEAPRIEVFGDPREVRRRAVDALREMLRRLGERVPLLLWIDDMQWVDVDSLQLLAEITRPPQSPRLLIVCTSRQTDGERAAVMTRLLTQLGERAHRTSLEPLATADALDLARSLLGDELAHAARQVVEETGGNPFFMAQLASYMLTVETVAERRIGVDAVLAARLGALTPRARHVLEVIAIAAEPVTRTVLSTAARASFDELATDLRLLRVATLIESEGGRRDDRVRMIHQRVAAAALGLLSDERRQHVHRQLALALEEWDEGTPDELARHWRGAGNHTTAATYARRAAEAAAERLDFDRAATWFQTTLVLGAFDPAQESALETEIAEALANSGRASEAAAAFLRAAGAAEPDRAGELRRRATELLLASGHIARGLAGVDELLATFNARLAPSPRRALLSRRLRRTRGGGPRYRQRAAEQVPPKALARADVYWTVAAGLSGIDPLRGADFSARYMQLATATGEPMRTARGLALDAVYDAMLGPEELADRLLDEARTIARTARDSHSMPTVELLGGIANVWRGSSVRASLAAIDEAHAHLANVRGVAVRWRLAQAKAYAVTALTWLADLPALAARAEAYLHDADQRGDRYLSTWIRTRASLFRLASGRPELALGESDAVIRDWSADARGYQLPHHFARVTRAEVALYTGRMDRAAEILAEHQDARAAQLLRINAVRIEDAFLTGRLHLARALSRRAGDSEGQRHLRGAQAQAKRLGRERGTVGPALSRLLAGAIALERGDDALATRELRAASVELEAVELGLHAAVARAAAGSLGERGPAAASAEAWADWCRQRGVAEPARIAGMVLPRRRK